MIQLSTLKPLGITTKPVTKEVQVGEYIINVKQTIPTYEKYELVNGMLGACTSGYRDSVLHQMLLDILVVKYYSDIVLTADDIYDIYLTHQILTERGFVKAVQTNVNGSDYALLLKHIETTQKDYLEYTHSAGYASDAIGDKVAEFFGLIMQKFDDWQNSEIEKNAEVNKMLPEITKLLTVADQLGIKYEETPPQE